MKTITKLKTYHKFFCNFSSNFWVEDSNLSHIIHNPNLTIVIYKARGYFCVNKLKMNKFTSSAGKDSLATPMSPPVGNDEQSPLMKDCMQRLKRLDILRSNGFITDQEYQTRKRQIVDELTDTTLTYHRPSVTVTSMSATYRSRRTTGTTGNDSIGHPSFGGGSAFGNGTNGAMSPLLPPIGAIDNSISGHKFNVPEKINRISRLPLHVPDWNNIHSENALKWKYIYETDSWQKYEIRVKIEETAFNQGRKHFVFHLQDVSRPDQHYVAKMSKKAPNTQQNNFEQLYSGMKEEYSNRVKMQAIARHCAFESGYNSYNIKNKKEILFLEISLLYLIQREDTPMCYMQPFVQNYSANNSYYGNETYTLGLDSVTNNNINSIIINGNNKDNNNNTDGDTK